MELTEQQKLEILCAYLPHGVEVESDKIYKGFRTKLVAQNLTTSLANGLTISSALDYKAKLILRHPDDMTEEELAKYIELWESDSNFIKCATDCLRYLHSIHIDTFGAIESGWAVRK